jgi:hypothetical protein
MAVTKARRRRNTHDSASYYIEAPRLLHQNLWFPELLHRSPEVILFPELQYEDLEYYIVAHKYYTTKEPECYTTTNAASGYHTVAPKYYSAPSYYTEAPVITPPKRSNITKKQSWVNIQLHGILHQFQFLYLLICLLLLHNVYKFFYCLVNWMLCCCWVLLMAELVTGVPRFPGYGG